MKDETGNTSATLINDNINKTGNQPGKFVIENGKGTRLVVSNCGAAVVSLFVKDRRGLFSDVVLGYDTPADYLKDDYYIGTVVGRYANRILGDTVQINDHLYKITVKEGGYHHHGGKTGFNKKIFTEELFSDIDRSGVIFRYTSPHLEEGFPGELQLEVIYTLDNDDTWTVEYKAVSTEATLINLTQHSYFNLTGSAANKIDDHELLIESSQYLPVNIMQVPTGEIADVEGTPFDFSKSKKIGQDISAKDEQLKLSRGYDHSFVLERQHTRELKHAAVLREPVSGRRMDVFTTEPAIHLYTGNFLDNVRGKENAVYNSRSGLCLETQHFPDSPNHAHFPSAILKAGKQFYSKTVFKFSTE